MAGSGEAFTIEIDVEKVLERFGKTLPSATREELIAAMGEIVGKWEAGVQHNIEQMFSKDHRPDRPPHLPLTDSILGRVFEEEGLVVGEVSYDLAETPYARILEMGGVIPAHTIVPRMAGALYFPAATLSENVREGELTIDQYIMAFHVDHPGANIPGFHYILTALLALSKAFENDIEKAVVRAIKRTE